MYYRVKTRSRKKAKQHRELKGLALILLSFIISYCLIVPQLSGVLGQSFARMLFLFLGRSAYIIPLIILWWGWILLKSSYQQRWRLDFIWGLLLLCVASSFLTIFGESIYKVNFGGWLGLKLGPFFRRLFWAVYLACSYSRYFYLYLKPDCARIIKGCIVIYMAKTG